MGSGEGTGAEGTNGIYRACACACAWGGEWVKRMRYYGEYTVHGGTENLHNVMSRDGRELHYLLVPENNRARLFVNTVQPRKIPLCDQRWIVDV